MDFICLTQPRIVGWDRHIGEDGFVTYTHSTFNGCIRLNRWDGTSELYYDRGPLTDPARNDAHYEERGHFGCSGIEQLVRCMLCLECTPGSGFSREVVHPEIIEEYSLRCENCNTEFVVSARGMHTCPKCDKKAFA